MKQGRTLQDLAIELDRQAAMKKDFVAQNESIGMRVVHDATIEKSHAEMFLGDWNSPSFSGEPNSVAHRQIGTYTNVPAKYYDRMRGEAPDLLAMNVNHWLRQSEGKRMVRTLDGRVRAFLSDSYRPLENYDFAQAALPVLMDLGVEVMSCEVTDRKLYIKVVDERIKRDIPTGKYMGDGSHTIFDTCSPALILSNSEVGAGALTVQSGMFTKVCTNLAVFADAGLRKRHLGAKFGLGDADGVRHLLSDDTKAATDTALWMVVRDVVEGAFKEARFDARIEKLTGMRDDRIEGDPVKAIELGSKALGLTEGEGKSVLRHLIEGGDLTRYGLFNAVTRTAQDVDSYDRATEIEAIGGSVVELPRGQWKEIAQAA